MAHRHDLRLTQAPADRDRALRTAARRIESSERPGGLTGRRSSRPLIGLGRPIAAALATLAFAAGVCEAGAQVTVPPGAGTNPVAFGSAQDFANRGPAPGAQDLFAAMAVRRSGRGYWLASPSGQVFAFGTARTHGAPTLSPGDRVVGIAASDSGGGYWLATQRGAVLSEGRADPLGSVTDAGAPIVAISATPDSGGYWLLASTGQLWPFGDARLVGSPPADVHDVVAMASSPDGRGYWLVSKSGGVLSYGDAHFYGSALRDGVGQVVGIAATPDRRGYWIATSSGRVLAFGDAQEASPARRAPADVVAIAPSPHGDGYWLLGAGPPAQAAPTPTPAPAPAPAPAPSPSVAGAHVTAIGDSVMLDAAPDLVADIPGIDVEAAVSRQWDDGIAVAEELKAEHRLGPLVVIDLGTNGPVTPAQFADMMDALSGASLVVFVTVHLPPSYSWATSVNATLEAGVAHYPNTRLADFNALADEHPGWFGADGVHMPIGGPGAQAIAALIKAAL